MRSISISSNLPFSDKGADLDQIFIAKTQTLKENEYFLPVVQGLAIIAEFGGKNKLKTDSLVIL